MLAVQYRNIKHIPSSFSSVCLSVCRCRSFLHWDFEQIQTLWSGAERGWFHMQHQQGVWSRLAPQRWGLLLDSLLIQTCLLWEHGSDPHQPSWILMSSTMPPVTQCMPELDTCLFIPPRKCHFHVVAELSKTCLHWHHSLSRLWWVCLFSRNKTRDSSEQRCDVSRVWCWSVSDGQVR